jgi:hypothetical protein
MIFFADSADHYDNQLRLLAAVQIAVLQTPENVLCLIAASETVRRVRCGFMAGKAERLHLGETSPLSFIRALAVHLSHPILTPR